MERETNHRISDEAREGKANTASYASWLTLVFPPAVWAIQMQLNYWLIRGACARGSNRALALATAISVTVVAIEGLFCWIVWQRLKVAWSNDRNHEDSRERFMALLGALVAGMFLLAIIAQGLASVFIAPCQT